MTAQPGWVRSWAFLLIQCFVAAELSADDELNIQDLWKKVSEVNRVWLDPKPENLSYKVFSGSPVPMERRETLTLAWVSGDKARYELIYEGVTRKLIMTPERAEWLEGPNVGIARPNSGPLLRDLRQAVTWRTVMHALYERGLPENARIDSDVTNDGKRLVVLEVDLAQHRSQVGLGLSHVYYGFSQRPIGQVELTIQLPDHVPVLEKWTNGEASVVYDEDFFQADKNRAPKSIQYVSTVKENLPWILEGQFQLVDGVWLLKDAKNIQGERIVKQMTVTDASTEPIDAERFALPTPK